MWVLGSRSSTSLETPKVALMLNLSKFTLLGFSGLLKNSQNRNAPETKAQRDEASSQDLRAWVVRWDLYHSVPLERPWSFHYTMEVVSQLVLETNQERRKNSLIFKHLKGLYTTPKFSQYVFLQNTENECLLGHAFSLLNKLLHQKAWGARGGKNGALETLVLVTYIVTYTLVVTQGSPPSNPSLIPKRVAAWRW